MAAGKGSSRDNDLLISIGGDIENLKIALAQARTLLKKGLLDPSTVAKMSLQAKDIGKEYANTFNQPKAMAVMKKNEQKARDALNARRVLLRKTLDPEVYKAVQKEYTSLGKTAAGTQTQVQRLAMAQQIVTKRMKSVTTPMKKAKVEFAGWAMSIMFFGMALQRMFNTVWKQSTKTFQDVMHSTAGTVTGFDMLQGSLDYLKFTAGAALEPIATYLYPIIDSITDWISTNEGLFSSLVILFGILGTAFMVGGSGKLALDGFTQLSNLTFGNFDIAGKGGILALISTPVGAGVIAALIALAAVGAVSWKSFSETPEAWRAMKDAMSEAASPLSDMAKSLKILIELVFDFQVNWESVAWTIVWVTRVVGAMLKMWLAPLNAVFNAVMAIVNALLAMNSVKKGDFQAAKEFSRSAINNQDAVVDAFKDAMLIPNLLNVGTPGSIKREYEAKNEQQRIDSSTSQLGNLYETAPQLHLTVQLDTDVITNEVVKKLNFMGDIIR